MLKNMNDDFLINCEKLSVGYTHPVASNISFTLGEKKILLIKGKNGSGKSTLIKTLLKKITPMDGSFKWNIAQNNIAYLPQITNPNSSFSFNVNEILDLYSVKKEFREKLPINMRDKKWINCSGGEKQKTMLLTRISAETKVLILDEPFNHLDDSSVLEVAEMLINIVQDKRLSIILVSHMNVTLPKDLLETVELN